MRAEDHGISRGFQPDARAEVDWRAALKKSSVSRNGANANGKMIHTIWLVRHGLLNEDLGLSEEGRRFASGLHDLIGNTSVDRIISADQQRCIDTVTPLANNVGISVRAVAKSAFERPASLVSDLGGTVAVICYQIECVNPLLHYFGFEPYCSQTRDRAYAEIIRAERAGDAWVETRISTGFARNR